MKSAENWIYLKLCLENVRVLDATVSYVNMSIEISFLLFRSLIEFGNIFFTYVSLDYRFKLVNAYICML